MRRVFVCVMVVAAVATGCAKKEDVTVTGASSAPVATTASNVPTIKITSPKAGDTVASPMKVTYEINGFAVGSPPKGHFHAIWGTGANDYAAFANITGPSGTVTASKTPPGSVHEVTFQLANANHSLLKNPEAKVVVKNLTFTAAKTAGSGY